VTGSSELSFTSLFEPYEILHSYVETLTVTEILKLLVLPSTNPIGEIGSRYPTSVYGGIRLLLPLLRQKMALSGVAQTRPRVSKLGFKGLSDYYSDEIAVRQPDGRPVGQVKGLLS
jgi:hypothetical protein